MSGKIHYLSVIFELILVGIPVFLFASVSAFAQNGKRVETLRLGETAIKINIYEKRGSAVTFVALHHNEQISINLAKKLVETKGGRLIEIEAFDDDGQPTRRLKFEFEKNSYSVDPNRIFTDNGRTCDNAPPVAVPEIKTFAEALLKIILPPNGRQLRKGESFVVSLHNNQNIDDPARNQMEKEKDLTAFAYLKGGKTQHPLFGQYQAQAEGVFISNVEEDEDNFVFLSSPAFLSYFAGEGFNVVLQKPAAKLKTPDCETDDGSLSVYFGQRNLSYIGLEADRDNGENRQKEMIQAVYRLVKK